MIEGQKINRIAYHTAEKLATQSQLFVRVAVPKDDSLLITLLASAGDTTTNMHQVGPLMPLYCNAPGKAILANRSSQYIKAYLERTKFHQFTENTITDPIILKSELILIKSRGYAISKEELRAWRSGIGAAILKENGEVAGSISVHGETKSMFGKNEKRLVEQTMRAAEEISFNLGYRHY